MSTSTLRRAAVTHPDKFFVDGQWITPSSSATIDVINPTTEDVFLTVAEATNADIDRASILPVSPSTRGPGPA